MEIQDVESFIEKPVIDITVEFIGAPGMVWTIDDVPESEFRNGRDRIHFRVTSINGKAADIEVNIERRNLAWSSISKRIDRIPVKREGPARVGQPR